jgi:hypothetical protein
VQRAKALRVEGRSDAMIMVELAQGGASAGEAEGVVRSLGGSFALDARDQHEQRTQKFTARLGLAAGVGLVGVALWLAYAMFESAQTSIGAVGGAEIGGALVAGLTLIGKNIGTT